MKALFHRASNRGVSLIELVVAVAIGVSVFTGLMLAIPKVSRSNLELRSRQTAISVANTQIQNLKAKPYGLLEVTPPTAGNGGFFTSDCDCENVDFTRFPTAAPHTESVQVGVFTYRQQTCINYVKKDQTSMCPAAQFLDPGLKKVVVQVSWVVPGGTKTFRTVTSVSEHSMGNMDIKWSTMTLRLASISPAGVADYNDSALQNAVVALYNDSFMVTRSYAPPQILLSVPAGINYTLHVHSPNLLPYHQTGFDFVTGQTVASTVSVRARAAYGSHLTGEVALAKSFPIITRVIAGFQSVSGCTGAPVDTSEAIEIYNPTNRSFTFGTDIAIAFYNASTPSGTGDLFEDYSGNGKLFSGATPSGTYALTLTTVTTKTIPAKGYFLIAGRDPAAAPSAIDAMGRTPDITYTAGPTGYDLVSDASKSGGGAVRLFKPVNNERWSAGGTRIHYAPAETVQWAGDNGVAPTFLQPTNDATMPQPIAAASSPRALLHKPTGSAGGTASSASSASTSSSFSSSTGWGGSLSSASSSACTTLPGNVCCTGAGCCTTGCIGTIEFPGSSSSSSSSGGSSSSASSTVSCNPCQRVSADGKGCDYICAACEFCFPSGCQNACWSGTQCNRLTGACVGGASSSSSSSASSSASSAPQVVCDTCERYDQETNSCRTTVLCDDANYQSGGECVTSRDCACDKSCSGGNCVYVGPGNNPYCAAM